MFSSLLETNNKGEPMNKRILSLWLCLLIILVTFLPAQTGKVPNYSNTPRKDIPTEYKWKIEDIYASDADWQKDKAAMVALIAQIDQKKADWTKSPQNMLVMFDLLTAINMKANRLSSYANHQNASELSNSHYRVLQGELQAIMVDYSSKLAFKNDDLVKMDEKTLMGYFKKEPKLEPYRFNVEQILRSKKHILPEDKQKIVALSGLFSGTMEEAAGMLDDVDMPAPEVTLSNGEKALLNYINYSNLRRSTNRDDRTLVMQTYWNNHRQFENTFASILNGQMKKDYFIAKVYDYKDCLEARLYDEAIDTMVYIQLIKTTRQHLEPLHRLIKLKQELLGIDKMRYEDIYASSVKEVEKQYTVDEGREIVLASLKPLGPDYVNVVQKAFTDRWIDMYPNKDKQTGAYSGGIYDVHPFIKMNYSGTYGDVSTLTHELGHALHSYLTSKNQHYANADYTTFMAEIASTFNENLLVDYILKNEKDDLLKLFIIDSYLDEVRSTIYRQVLFAEFELAMHRHIENGNSLTPDWLNKTYLDLVRFYYGHDKGIMQVDDYIQNEWSGIPHFYLDYYVFQYSTGIIASMALSNKVLAGEPGAFDKYLNLLKAGGSAYSLDIVKKAGVDMTTSAPTEAALKRFDDLVGEMEKIVARLKAQGKL